LFLTKSEYYFINISSGLFNLIGFAKSHGNLQQPAKAEKSNMNVIILLLIFNMPMVMPKVRAICNTLLRRKKQFDFFKIILNSSD
jgi:hypothetical protein